VTHPVHIYGLLHICRILIKKLYILLSLVKLQFDTRKIIITMRNKKKLKRSFLHFFFFLQIIKFEEIRKNCLYIIIYRLLHIVQLLYI